MKRRNFLKAAAGMGTGMFLGDVIRLYTGVQKSIFLQAYAASGEELTRSYVNFHMFGAPPRWLFDQWLTPNPTDMVLTPSTAATWNTGIATAFASNQPVYQLTNYRGVKVPSYYLANIAGSAGARPMTDLLNHMAVIRGYNSLTDGHEINAPLQAFPDPAAPSLHGFAADNRQDLISAVSTNFSQHSYNSKKGLTLSMITDHNAATGGSINGLMKVFRATNTTKPGLLGLDQIRDVVNQLHEAAQAQANQSNGRSGAIKDQLKSVRDLSLLAAEDLVGKWASIYEKYRSLATSSLQSTMSIDGFRENSITVLSSEGKDVNGTDISTSFDLRESLLTAVPSANMLRSFALAEYCLKNQITGALALGWGDHLNGLTVRYGTNTANSSTYTQSDQHTFPQRLGTVTSAGYYRALASCMTEFIDVLKGQTLNGKTLFDQTVIHVTGDFGRSPRTDTIGSDHGFDSQVTSVFSGAISGPMIVGNIAATGRANYTGVWGRSAPVDFNGMKETLSPRHAAAAVAHLIGGTNPWSFTNLVWQLDSSGRLQPKVGAKIV